MKFWVKLNFRDEKNAAYLISAFFKNFNPESSIEIKGKGAKAEIFFENPPMEIINSISYCEILEFSYGEVPLERNENANMQSNVKKELANLHKQKDSEESKNKEEKEEKSSLLKPKDSKEKEVEKTKKAKEDKQTVAKMKCAKNSDVREVVELTNIANQSTSYEEFTKSVTDWLALGKRQEIFKHFIKAASQVEEITWKNIKETLQKEGVSFTNYDQIFCTTQVANKFKESKEPVTILALLKAIQKYETFNFNVGANQETVLTEESQTPIEQVNVEEKVTSQEIPDNLKSRIKMECMPEIPWFEEVLGSVDKTQPIEERVRYVLESMGVKKKKARERQEIFEITNTAVRLEEISFETIFVRVNIRMEDTMNARATFAKFIAEFLEENGGGKKVKLLDFLKDLQNVIILENEIEKFEDFTE